MSLGSMIVIPEDHFLRRLDVFVTAVLADLHEHLQPSTARSAGLRLIRS